MIIIHDETLKLQHVIFEHPENYTDVLDKIGHTWIHTPRAIALDHIRLSRHPETNAIRLHREAPGEPAELIAHDDKRSLAEKRAARAEALEAARRRQAEIERQRPPVAVEKPPEFAHIWTVRI